MTARRLPPLTALQAFEAERSRSQREGNAIRLAHCGCQSVGSEACATDAGT